MRSTKGRLKKIIKTKILIKKSRCLAGTAASARRRNCPNKKRRAQQAREIAKGAGTSDLGDDREDGQAGGQVKLGLPWTPLQGQDARGSQARSAYMRDGQARRLKKARLQSLTAEVVASAGSSIVGEGDEQGQWR